jgi:hypothetical protein
MQTFPCLPGFCAGDNQCREDKLQPADLNPLCARCPQNSSSILNNCVGMRL